MMIEMIRRNVDLYMDFEDRCYDKLEDTEYEIEEILEGY